MTDSMTDSILWVSDNTAVNLNSIAYVKFETGTAKIVFPSGEMITLDGKDSMILEEHFRRMHRTRSTGVTE